jgi:hypothetical protein
MLLSRHISRSLECSIRPSRRDHSISFVKVKKGRQICTEFPNSTNNIAESGLLALPTQTRIYIYSV